MIFWKDLDRIQRLKIVSQGIVYYVKHLAHVTAMIEAAKTSYPPSGSDLNHPELWKEAHWKWFKELKVSNKEEGIEQ